MHLPAITALYLAVLALLYAVLGMQVSRLRRGNRVRVRRRRQHASFAPRSARHANFVEYVPIIALMVGAAGNVRAAADAVHC